MPRAMRCWPGLQELWTEGSGAGLALAYAAQYPHHTTAVVYVSGTGIDPRWHDDYRRNRLVSLGDAERQEFQRLRACRERASGA